MPTTVEDVTAKAEMLEIEPKSGVDLKPTVVDHKDNEAEPKVELNGDGSVEKEGEENKKNEAKVDEVSVPDEVETKTGISFPGKLDDGKLLKAVGLRKKSMLGMGIKIYAFGIYADNEKLRELVTAKVGKAPSKPTKEMLPGYTLQTKVMGEIVSTVESELLCRAYIYMYLGEDPFDKEAKEKFGISLLSLF
ncbi:unnamed protein product [Fraxinus pennsylvanica]|uniref:Chalcone-flavonone isomerase family protein n=1 Tax=Fraxinus pennsylvanica TaxID=56036 RepID=A0AAD1YWT6_9LAMI|nr:unnamed protein product [Fraxinus pennsylvanica]